jgi:ATP-dependent Clp protease ATP-binding subunit ClpA
MFEHFTEKAIKVIMLAQEESRRLGHNFVGTEQILLGLIGEGTGIAAKVLISMGIKLKSTRIEVEKIIGRGSGFVAAEIPFTPRAKRVLELSLEEARQLEHNYIGTEHLLLGLIRERQGIAIRVLENLGAVISIIRLQVISNLKDILETTDSSIFEIFTEQALTVIMLAQEEAQRLGDNFLGPEQILLGLIREEKGVAANVLNSIGVNFKGTQIEIEKLIGKSSDNAASMNLLFTPKAKRVLEMSLREAQDLGHNYIGTEHLLLGLICGEKNSAVKVLEILHINLAEMRTRIISMLEVSSLRARVKDATITNKYTYKCTDCSHEVIALMCPSECDICGSSVLVLLN